MKLLQAKPFIAVTLIAALLAPDFARATQEVSCHLVAVTQQPGDSTTAEQAKANIIEALDLDSAKRKDRKIEAKIQKIDFEKDFSEDDVRLMMRKLFNKKLGEEVGFRKDVFKPVTKANDERIDRVMAEEAASQGLIEFFAGKDQLVSHDRLLTLWDKVFNNRKVQVAIFLASLTRMHLPVPTFYTPHFKPIRPTEEQLNTLLLYGKDSPEGQAVIDDLAPKFARDNRRVLFVKAINTVALIATIIMWMIIEDKRAEAHAAQNGDLFVKHVADKIDKITSEVPSAADTKDDHLYDIVSQKLEVAHGPLTSEDRAQVCLQIAAPHRCP